MTTMSGEVQLSSDNGPEQKLAGDIIQLSEHHKKTGCTGEVKSYIEDGAFCVSCKGEWLLSDLNKNIAPDCDLKPVAHHYVPTFCCLQVSDTGHYVPWRDIHKLKRGDHVAWLRPPSYWHHAIVTEDVQEGASEFHVIEWSPKKICENTKKKIDLLGNWCYSPMYKVVYPKEIVDQNPPDLIMLRAETMMSLDSKYSLFVDNCEHFATFCKTGSHKCNQLFQFRVTMRAWIARFLVAFLHVAFVVSFSETIEWFVPNTDEDWLGAIILFAFECLSLLMIIFITYKIDTPKEKFKRSDQSGCTSACKRAVIKSIMQSLTLMGFVALFGVYFVGLLASKNDEQWSVKKRVGIEMGLGCLGGIIGNMVGFILFHFIPYPCCHTVIGKEDNAGKGTKHVEEGKEIHPQSQSKSVESTPVPKRSAISSDISETTYRDQRRLSRRKGDAKDDEIQMHVKSICGSKIKLNMDGDTPNVRRETPSREGEEGESGTDSTQLKTFKKSLSLSTEDVNLKSDT